MRSILVIWFCVLPAYLFSQINDRDTLREVLIKDKKTGSITHVQTVDSSILLQYQQSSLQHVLQLHSNVFVKNYGVGSVSTISIRGSSAAQTSVRWHGMSINNAMTGISDFSILPVMFFDEIKINYSGSPSSALGGYIGLNNLKPVFRKRTEINIGGAYESLQNGAGYASLSHSGSTYAIIAKGFYQQSENEFNFYNSARKKYEKMVHADSRTKGIITDLYLKINPQQTLAVHFWAQETQREIPPALFEDESRKNEKNKSVKALLDHEMNSNVLTIKTSVGFMKDQLEYSDSLIAFSSVAQAITLPATYAVSWFPSPQQKVSVQASANYSKMYGGPSDEIRRGSVSLHYEAEPLSKRLFVSTFIQKEYSNMFMLPLIAGLNLKQKLYRENYLIASVSSNYRMPTLNELFFVPGGNKNLKPENSRNLEGGIVSSIRNSRHLLQGSANLFTREVKNWIVWYGGSILTPHNIQEVWSRGMEVDVNYRLKMRGQRYEIRDMRSEKRDGRDLQAEAIVAPDKKANYKFQPSTFNVQLLYSYTLSTTSESAIANDYSIGKQIPYVPRYQLKMNIGITKNAFDISYVYAYTGYRFVTTDESEYLLPYNTHNVFASYRFKAGSKHQLLATFKINNLLNSNYESIIGRMMPGRTFSVGLNYRFRNY